MHIDPKTKKVKLTDTEVRNLDDADAVVDSLIQVNYPDATPENVAGYKALLATVKVNQAAFPPPQKRKPKMQDAPGQMHLVK